MIDYSWPTFFACGVIATNFRRLSWADRLRFAARVIGRRSLERLDVPAIGFEGADLEQLDGEELIAEGCHGVTRYEPTCDKIMRMNAQTAMIENGFVRIPETAPWLDEYLHEMTVFPRGKYDDQVDSTAQFLDWFKRPFPGQNIFELYRKRAQEAEQRRNPQPTQPSPAPGSLEWLAAQRNAT